MSRQPGDAYLAGVSDREALRSRALLDEHAGKSPAELRALGLKRCSRCGLIKPRAAFPPRRLAEPHKIHPDCRVCRRLAGAGRPRDRRWASEHPERKAEVERRYRERNREALRLKQRLWDLRRDGTPRRKLSRALSRARRQLRAAANPASRQRLEARIALIEAELRRLGGQPPRPRNRHHCDTTRRPG